jgi:hypothetical protein
MPEPRLFLDADGVLADFDEGALRLLGMTLREYERKHGRGAFWKRLAQAKNFYGTLPEMPDARVLFDAVKHLDPTILTGLPLGRWAAPQKVEWRRSISPGFRSSPAWPATSTNTCMPATCWSTTGKTTAPRTKRRA